MTKLWDDHVVAGVMTKRCYVDRHLAHEVSTRNRSSVAGQKTRQVTARKPYYRARPYRFDQSRAIFPAARVRSRSTKYGWLASRYFG
jgi:hypothetical protein